MITFECGYSDQMSHFPAHILMKNLMTSLPLYKARYESIYLLLIITMFNTHRSHGMMEECRKKLSL